MSQPAMDLTEFERASLRLLERAWLLAQACARARDPRCASSDAGEPDPGNPVHHLNMAERNAISAAISEGKWPHPYPG